MKKTIISLLLVLCLACFCAVSASAMVEGDLGTLNIIWSDSLGLTTPGQTTYEVDAETYVMSLSISSKLNGQTLYISAHEGVEVMINSVTQHPTDGWYVLNVKSLKIALVNWNKEAVTLTMQTFEPGCEHKEEIITGTAATCTETGLTDGKKCTICGETTLEQTVIPALGHSYTDGICGACGAADPDYVKLFDIDVARMILGNALEFQFGVAATKIPDTTGYYAVIEKEWADGTTTTKTIPANEWGTAGQYWAIVYDGLAAKEMADTFYVTIYNGEHVQVSNTKEDSVRAYVARAYASQKATGKTMMVDMLNYGAAAQLHFNYGANDLANSKLTEAQKAMGTSATPTMTNNVVKGANYTASRFILANRIQVQVGFKGLKNGMYAIYTYDDNNGKEQKIRIESKDFVMNGASMIGVELSQLVYADARAMVKVAVYNADGTLYGYAEDSIESCCFRSTGDLFAALMKFADSARMHIYNK